MDKEEEKTSIKTHEDLIIYQKAFDVAMTIFELSKQFPVEERYSLTDQIRRSSRSVCANLAEAWRKRRDKASFVAKLNDCEAEGAETQVWLKFALNVTILIAKINGESTNTVRRRLKEWYLDSKSKKGKKRRELDVSKCFAPLLLWVLSLWKSEEKWLPLAIDATYIGQNFTVLSVHVLYQSCGIPVAWKIVKGTEKGSWKPLWQELFQCLKDVIPKDWQVIVSADRGLYADWLFSEICGLNWHPFLRINHHQGNYQIRGEQEWRCLNTLVPNTGMSFAGDVICFKSNPLECTLLARWDEGYQDPWLIVTDLEPEQANVLWYGLRSWIESSYRDLKSDGWQWHKTRLTEPARAERIWLAMAVATLWTITMGSEPQKHLPETVNEEITDDDNLGQKSALKKVNRSISCFLPGLINIVANLICGKGIHLNDLSPQLSFAVNTS